MVTMVTVISSIATCYVLMLKKCYNHLKINRRKVVFFKLCLNNVLRESKEYLVCTSFAGKPIPD